MGRRMRSNKRRKKAKINPEDAVDSVGCLIPGLLDEIVLQHILPRTPWYQRVLMTSISKSWHASLKNPRENLASLSRPFLHDNKGLVFIYTSIDDPDFEYMFEYYDMSTDTWYDLPPLPKDVDDCLYAGGCLYSICKRTIFKLDIAAGMWTWEKTRMRTMIKRVFLSVLDDTELYICGRQKLNTEISYERHNIDTGALNDITDFERGHKQHINVLLNEHFRDVDVRGLIFSNPFFFTDTGYYTSYGGHYLYFYGVGPAENYYHIDMKKKLSTYTQFTIEAMATQEGCLYVLTRMRSSQSFTLWRGAPPDGTQTWNDDGLVWEKMKFPFQAGTSRYRVHLRSFP